MMFKSVLLASIGNAAATVGKSTYAMTHPFAYKDFMEKYFSTAEHVNQENSTKLCNEWSKLCIDDGKTPFKCSGAYSPQVHAVGAYMRESGKLSLETMEDYFTQAMGGMKTYDPFMELHIAWHTDDLDPLITLFKADSVPYFASTFVDSQSSKSYDSIIVQIEGSLKAGAGSMLAFELISSSSKLLKNAQKHQHAVARASSASLQRAEQLAAERLTISAGSSKKPALTQLHISWPSSDVARDKKYFLDTLKGTSVSSESKAGVTTFTGKLFSDDTVELRWVSVDTESQGPWKVSEWETYASSLHSQCMTSPNRKNQGFDRLADNHIGGHGSGMMDLGDYITRQIAAGLPYRVYAAPDGSPNFLYLYGPNGWGYQITGQCKRSSMCGNNLVFYNECTQGVTGSCSKDLPSSVVV